jgi:hypothetical protein
MIAAQRARYLRFGRRATCPKAAAIPQCIRRINSPTKQAFRVRLDINRIPFVRHEGVDLAKTDDPGNGGVYVQQHEFRRDQAMKVFAI